MNNKIRSIHTNSALERIPTHATTWLYTEDMLPSKTTQTQMTNLCGSTEMRSAEQGHVYRQKVEFGCQGLRDRRMGS